MTAGGWVWADEWLLTSCDDDGEYFDRRRHVVSCYACGVLQRDFRCWVLLHTELLPSTRTCSEKGVRGSVTAETHSVSREISMPFRIRYVTDAKYTRGKPSCVLPLHTCRRWVQLVNATLAREGRVEIE